MQEINEALRIDAGEEEGISGTSFPGKALGVDGRMIVGSSRLRDVGQHAQEAEGGQLGQGIGDEGLMRRQETSRGILLDGLEIREVDGGNAGNLGDVGAEGRISSLTDVPERRAAMIPTHHSFPDDINDRRSEAGKGLERGNLEFVGLGLSSEVNFEQETQATVPLGVGGSSGIDESSSMVGEAAMSEREMRNIVNGTPTPPRDRRVASNDSTVRAASPQQLSPLIISNPPSPKLGASPSRGPRSFLTNLLSRATSPRIPPASLNSRTTPPSPTIPATRTAQVARSPTHTRSSSVPASNRATNSTTDSSGSAIRSSMEPTRIPSPASSPTINRRPLTPRIDAETDEAQFLPAAPIFDSNPPTPIAPPDSSSTTPQPTLSSIGLSLHALTPPLPLARNFSALCGVILDDVLLIGTANGLYFLPLPVPGSLNEKGKGRKKERKPIALIKRTRFAQLAVLNERSNILLAIAGKNSHIRVYTLDGIRALIERRLNDYDINSGYAMKSAVVVPSLIKKSRSDKGKSRLPPANISTSRGISSSDYFARSGSGPVSPPPDYDSIPRRRPSSINYASFAGSMAAGASVGGSASGSGGTPTRIHSRASSSGSIVRAVSTNPPLRVGGVRGSTSTIRGPAVGERLTRGSISTSEAEEEEIVVAQEEIVTQEVERTLGSPGGVGLIRTTSSSSTTGSEWATDQGSPTFSRPPNNRPETPSDSQHSSPLIPSSSSAGPRETGSIFANYEGFNSTVSPSLSLTEFTPEGPIGEERVVGEDVVANLPIQKFAREAATPKLTTGISPPALQLAQMFRDTGPDDVESSGAAGDTSWEMVPDERSDSPISTLSNSTFSRLEPREATTRRASYRELEEEDNAATPSGDRQSFAQAIRDGPPISPPPLHTSNSSRSISSLHSNPPPSPRTASKRWSITGVGALFNRGNFVPSEVSPTTLLPPSTSVPSGLATPSTSTAPRESRDEARTTSSMDVKRKPVPTSHETPVTLPPSAAIMGEDHGHNLSSPLEYVKLARTKGARYLRAVETKKRSYLAVLTGDQGERIELFTGSRGTSLALNRTFVLPQTPSIIDFQMLGDELLDLYLVYPDSLFALEPQSVRVREVGIGRSERRTRRERERRMMQNVASTVENPATTTEGEEEPRLAPEGHPADRTTTPEGGRESTNDDTAENSRANSPLPPISQTDVDPTVDDSSSVPPVVPPRGTLPFTTFQQLSFIPTVPSSVLAPAWTIPPLYESHFGAPSTLAVRTDESTSSSFAPPPEFSEAPLLSPVSLLGGASQQATGATGPPQLFFVCKGKSLVHIVTGDGRSVIKRPILFNATPSLSPDDFYNRIEILTVEGKKTVIVGIGPFGIKAVKVEEETSSQQQALFGVAVEVESISVSRNAPRENGSLDRNIQFLGMDSKGGQLFFSERLSGSGSWGVFCLSSSTVA